MLSHSYTLQSSGKRMLLDIMNYIDFRLLIEEVYIHLRINKSNPC